MSLEDEMMTVAQVAAAKKVSRQAVYLAIQEDRLPAFKVGKIHLVRKDDLDAWQIVGHRPPEPHRPGLTIRDLGWTRVQAASARAQLVAFAADWDDPDMDIYNEPAPAPNL